MALEILPFFAAPSSEPGEVVLLMNNPSVLLAVKYLMCFYAIGNFPKGDPKRDAGEKILSASTDKWGPDESQLWTKLVPDPTTSQAYKGTMQPTALGLCALYMAAQKGVAVDPNVLTQDEQDAITENLAPFLLAACGGPAITGTVEPTDSVTRMTIDEARAAAQAAKPVEKKASVWPWLLGGGLLIGGVVLATRDSPEAK